jgi:periplasmic protein TonB
MNERARALWRRHAAFLVAVLLHIGLLWLVLPYMINREQPPPGDPLEVAIVPAPPPPPPKPVRPKPIVRPKPAVRPAEKNATAGKPNLQQAPRMPRAPPIDLKLPEPLPAKAPMTLPVASPPPAAGSPGNGQGGNGNGPGIGSQEGNDYLLRIKAYIDAHKNGERHREPNDADLVLVLDPNGVLLDIRVVVSSGDAAVDDEIVVQLRGMSPFPKPPAILFGPSQQRLAVADKWIFPRP